MYVCNTAKPFPFIPAASISAVDIVATATATGALGKEKMLEQDSTNTQCCSCKEKTVPL